MRKNLVAMFALASIGMVVLYPTAMAQERSIKRPPAAKNGATEIPKSEEPKEPKEVTTGKELINKVAFAKTQSAKTFADYTSIIDTCKKGMSLGVDKPTGEYATKLMAWAHNRCGEFLAAEAVGASDPKKRTELDQKALSEFETAISLDTTCWRAYHNHGVSLAQMREYDQAIADFNRALDINPSYANAWFNRGELRYAKGNYAEAIDDYNQAIRLNPRDAAAFNSRGHARYRVGQFREALDDYNQSVQFDPKNAAAYTNRGDAYMDQGQYERAATDYRTAIQLDAKYGRAFQSAAWLMATCPEERFRDAKKAIEAAEKALQLDGADDYHYLDALAAAYANAGRYDDAQSTLKQALTMTPETDAPRLKDRLTLYEQEQPYRDTPRVALRRPQRRPGATSNQ